ncbi:MAG: ABC transporter permease subunit [Desulfuromonadaceae bacterium]|nr:ABC transporter permease subunit [Desulfuromonadaceae bacterium]
MLAFTIQLASIGHDVEEAARDLFASNWYVMSRIMLLLMLPGVVAGAMLAFTLSLDDFVLSFFTSGPDSQTLPLYIYAAVRKGVTPEIHALSTLVVFITVVLVVGAERLGRKKEIHNKLYLIHWPNPDKNREVHMKKIFFAVMLLMSLFVRIGFAEDKELRIFTWSEYMDERRFAADFKAATGIKVKIDICENNEEMIAKLLAGGVKQYDIIVPSGFVLSILISQHLMQPRDHTKLPNLKNLSDRFHNIPYDPGNKYTVGWQWGTVGL